MRENSPRDLKKVDLAYEALKKMITTGELGPGSHLYAHELTDLLNTGLTPIREALMRLEVEGLIGSSRHRGFHVRRIDPNESIELYDFTFLVLKTSIDHNISAFLAPPKNTISHSDVSQDERQAARSLAHALETLYFRIASLSNNNQYVDAIARFNDRTRLVRFVSVELAGTSRVVDETERLVAALESGSVSRSTDLLQKHFNKFRRLVPDAIKEILMLSHLSSVPVRTANAFPPAAFGRVGSINRTHGRN